MGRIYCVRNRVIAAFIFSTVFSVVCGFTIRMPAAPPNPKYLDQAASAAGKSGELIRAEIKTLGDHEWAGEYYHGDGRGVNVSLLIAPKNGYVFEWHGCLGLYDRNYGAVVSKNKRLHLSFTFANEQEGFQGIAEQLIPVTWGVRKYLIPANDIVGFCNEVNQGREPRMGVHGQYLLRAGDEQEAVDGWPAIPEKSKPYLLAKPISGEIAKVGDFTTRPSLADFKFKDTTVTLNVGRNDGLLPGMKLYVTEPEDIVESVTIRKVEDTLSEGVVTQLDEDEAGPKVGWKLSTEPRWMMRKPTKVEARR